jgi:hypothetical protein
LFNVPRTGFADLPLHGGNAPRWLFTRMVKLATAISDVIVIEYGTEEFIRRLSDPFWFQAFSCVLGFDWHSSGTTTVTCGALKQALTRSDIMSVAGGKGKTSRGAPSDIESWSNEHIPSTDAKDRLVYASKMSAKVDSAILQDGHQLYHHSFVFDSKGNWTVIQQGMNGETGYARRYHWFSKDVSSFVEEPHTAIIGTRASRVLDMTSRLSEKSRALSVDLVNEGVDRLQRQVTTVARGQSTLSEWSGEKVVRLSMPQSINWNALRTVYEFHPVNYEQLISLRGVGSSTVRALALIGELIYGIEPSWRDPVKFSFTVGGKDGVPYPVDRNAMDKSIQVLKEGVEEAKLGKSDKLEAVQRLRRFVPKDVKVQRDRLGLSY